MMRRLLGIAAIALAGCSASGAAALPYLKSDVLLRSLNATGAGKIKHVVWVVQENRSFNDIFEGYPGAHTATSGKMSNGKTIPLQQIPLETAYEIDHSAQAMFSACNGTGSLPGTECQMNGFNNEEQFGGPQNGQYAYVPHSETKPYWEMAQEFVLADNMFQSQLDESFVAHQYIIAAQAQSSMNVPNSYWGCPGGSGDQVETITQQRAVGPAQTPCFDYQTFGDELDKAKLQWRFYTSKYTVPTSGLWSAYQAVSHIYNGPDWKKDIITPQKKFLTDVKAGKLASFTWVTPTCEDSDHVSCGGGFGPSWVASVVNAVGESKFWKSTAVFVQWDDWGGLYDPVAPPFEDYDGNGFRVGLIAISPYAKQNYVSHAQYETASVMRFAEDLFGLSQLSAADKRATSPANDCFDFSQKPRKFVPIDAPYDAKFFLRQPNDNRIPDEE
jgi:phospholipase C